ncbi:MAG: protein kinase [Halioglobus sp.]
MADFEIPGYEVYERLGRGGMATVFRALHLNLDREVAIKVMDTSLNSDESFAERFIREARISARLVHPHILQIYDVNSYDSLNYIAMELLSGGDLADTIRGSMTQRTIYDVMEQMCEALDYASSKGYVHRDIKPSNIMIRAEADYVLADFGIAKAANSGTQMTQTGLMVGTPSYMSPEQAKGVEVDGRSDIYALAVLFFEMLTKKLPYDSDSAVSTAVKHLTDPIPTLPEELKAYQPFLNKALAKEAGDRYQTGREMFAALSEVRSNFDDEAILTEVDPGSVQAAPEIEEEEDEMKTSAAWTGATQVSQPSRPSRPYKLHDTSSPDSLVSGIRTEQRSAGGDTGSFPVAKAALVTGAFLVVGAAGLAGYTVSQGKPLSEMTNISGLFSKDDGSMTAEELKAYVDERLAKAEIALAEADANPVRASQANEILSDVLSKDPGNAKATAGVTQLVTYYFGVADEAAAMGQFKAASSALESAKQLAPERTDIDDKVVSILELEEQWLSPEEALGMLQDGQQLIAQGDYVGAAKDFASVLTIYPENVMARESLDSAIDELLLNAQDAMKQGEFSEVAKTLSEASRLVPERTEIAELLEKLPEIEMAWSQNRQLTTALNSAGSLLRKNQFANAAQAYQAILEQAPGSSVANDGLVQSLAGLKAAARAALNSGNFDQAEALLEDAIALNPDDSANQALLDELPALESQWQDKQSRVAEQMKEAETLASDAARAIAIGDLSVARANYEQLSADYPDLEPTQSLKVALISAYAELAKLQLQDEDYDGALATVSQGQSLAPSDNWAALAQEIETTKAGSRRRLGAY